MERLEDQTKRLIVETLKVEQISPDEIDIDGLDLDSVDTLELGVAIRKTHDLKIEGNSAKIREHFANVRCVARFVATHPGG